MKQLLISSSPARSDRIEQLLGNHPSTLPPQEELIAPRSANPPTCRRTW